MRSSLVPIALILAAAWGSREAGATPEPGAEGEGDASSEGGDSSDVYEGCSSSKGCFGRPAKCEGAKTCSVMVTYRTNPDDQTKLDFELFRRTEAAEGRYAAVGFSEDAKMGDDLVFACLGKTRLIASWNQVGINEVGTTGVAFEDAKINMTDQGVTCSFTVPSNLSSVDPPGDDLDSRSFNLIEQKYFLLLAEGPTTPDESELQFHQTSRLASGSAVDLTSVDAVGAAGDGLIRAHGALMALAWLACGTCGTLLARYAKETHRGGQACGKDWWFVAHVLFMAATVVLSSLAFLLILVDRKGWNYTSEQLKDNPHPLLGLTCLLCAFLQPLMALLRCHPGDPLRWVFNLGHWLNGNVALVLALATVFLAGDLSAASFLPTEKHYRLMFAFVAVFVATHVVLTVQRFWATTPDRKVYVNAESPPGSNSDRVFEPDTCPVAPMDLPGTGLRKVVLVLWLLFSWLFTLVLVGLMASADAGKESWHDDEAGAEAEGEAEGEPES